MGAFELVGSLSMMGPDDVWCGIFLYNRRYGHQRDGMKEEIKFRFS